jgi:hypothetical protein
MKLGYTYYRDKLIELAILSVAGLAMFWDKLHGRGQPDDEPAALILIAIITVVGNLGLFIAMRRAKRREQAEFSQTRITHEYECGLTVLQRQEQSHSLSRLRDPDAGYGDPNREAPRGRRRWA